MGAIVSLVLPPALARAGAGEITDISDGQELASCKFARAKAPASKRPRYTDGCQRAASAERESSAFVAASAASFTYENPVYGSSFPDPGPLRDSSTDYYAYATGGGFPILKSPDLVHWERVGRAFSTRPTWVIQSGDWHPWAPSVLRSARACPGTTSPGCYFMYYVGLSAEHTPATHCVAVAWSLTPSGPFTDLGPIQAQDGATDLAGRPPGCGDADGYGNIDPAPFVDDDGSIYLYVSTSRRCVQPTTGSCPYEPVISVLPMTDTPTRAEAVRKPLFGATPGSWEQEPGDAAQVENPWMEKRGSTYYLLYSGGNYLASYGMGYATASSPTGGSAYFAFAKSALNPILSETADVLSPGGGSVTTGPDGGSWLVYHGRAGGYTEPRTLRIDPIFWSASSVVTPAPTIGAQTVPSGDIGAPQTTIDSGPSGATESAGADFTFSSSEARSSFECRLDGGTFEPCRSPRGYTELPYGQHTFEVRAIDSFGNADSTPAARSWTVGTAAPEASTGSAPALMPLADVTPPVVRLGGKRRQLARRTIGVIVRATSEDVWSTVSGTVRIAGSRKAYALKSVRERFIVRGGASTFNLSLSKKALRAIRRALRSHRSVTARVTMDARDAAGNITATKRTIALIL
jgi:hypothetical protein